jgi:predicted TIM-barrel fold metal-dependent hydrolase
MHLAEPGDLWADYIDPAFKDEYRKWTRTDASFSSLRQAPFEIPGSTIGGVGNPTSQIKDARAGDYEPYVWEDGLQIKPDGQLRAMDTEGIDVAVLFPTVGGRAWRDAPPPIALACAAAYNSWLADFCRHDPTRLKLNALVPIGDIDGAVAEINRAVTELGAVGISPGSSRADVRLDRPEYEPIWEEAARLNVPLTFHGSFQVHLLDRYRDSGLMSHATGRGIEHPLSFMELLYSGALERHPNLRCVFLEAGCSWVVYWLFRLEEEWEKYSRADPGLKKRVTMPPLEYWRRQCYSAIEVDEWSLRAVIDLVGDDNLVVSSDFPHFDSAFPHAFDHVLEIPGVSVESKRKILWDNCARLYGLD